jgi:hypothetical protein
MSFAISFVFRQQSLLAQSIAKKKQLACQLLRCLHTKKQQEGRGTTSSEAR